MSADGGDDEGHGAEDTHSPRTPRGGKGHAADRARKQAPAALAKDGRSRVGKETRTVRTPLRAREREGGKGPCAKPEGRQGTQVVEAAPSPAKALPKKAPARHRPESAPTLVYTLRKRYPRPSRRRVNFEGGEEQVGSCKGQVECMAAADSTVWCAEADGNITVREKDGAVIAVVSRSVTASVTAMVFVPGALSSSKMLVGYSDGTIASLDTAKAAVFVENTPHHTLAVTSLLLLHPDLVCSASLDGSVVFVNPFTLAAVSSFTTPSPATALAAGGRMVYVGGNDGVVKWNCWEAKQVDRTPCDGTVTALLVIGRNLWCSVGGYTPHLLILDTESMVEVVTIPTSDKVVKIFAVGGSVWCLHHDGEVTMWNAQTLQPVRCVAGGPITCGAPIQTVPEDYEVWLSHHDTISMWRNNEYTFPVWCAEHLASKDEKLEEAERTARHYEDALRAKEDTVAQLEAAREQIAEQLAMQNALHQSVQALADTNMKKFEAESQRRKKAEVELSELRQAVVTMHKALTPEEEHLIHYKPSDIKAALQCIKEAALGGKKRPLERSPSRGRTSQGEDVEQLKQRTQQLLDENAKLKQAMEGMVDREVVGALESDNLRLKDMLERLKTSHQRVNEQLVLLGGQLQDKQREQGPEGDET